MWLFLTACVHQCVCGEFTCQCTHRHQWRIHVSMYTQASGKVKRRKKEHETPGAEDEAENNASDNEVSGVGRACRQKGWWKHGDMEANLNTVNMTVWVHKECDITEEEALTKLQEAWDSAEQKDEQMYRVPG
jgi:hypothetical protein